MKNLSAIASNIFTALVLGGVALFGVHEMIPPDMQETAIGWLSWGAGGVIGLVIIASAAYFAIKTPTDGFAGSRLIKSYRTTITD